MTTGDDIDAAKRLIGALVRQPPRVHEDMKAKKTPQAVDKKARPASKGRVRKGKSGD
jgi:hypothetical protein